MNKFTNVIIVSLIACFLGFAGYSKIFNDSYTESVSQSNVELSSELKNSKLPKEASGDVVGEGVGGKEEEKIDNVLSKSDTILVDIQQNTGLKVEAAKSSEFEWIGANSKATTVRGSSMALELSFDQISQIENYFKQQGYEFDRYNIADGTIESLTGYRKGASVCKINTQSMVEEGSMPNENTLSKVNLSCGELKLIEMESPQVRTPPKVIRIKKDELVKSDEKNIHMIESVNLSIEYPKHWYAISSSGMLSLQNKSGTHDKFSRPEGFIQYWIDYDNTGADKEYLIKLEAQLNDKNTFQYSSSNLIDVGNETIDIRLYSFFDVDCGKGAKAFWNHDDKLYYAFEGKSCGDQITEERLQTFKDVLSNIKFN